MKKSRYHAMPKKVTKRNSPKIVKLYNSLTTKTELPTVTKTYIPQGQNLVDHMNDRKYINDYINENYKKANQRLYKMERYNMGLFTQAYKTAKHDVGLDPGSKQAVRFGSAKTLEDMTDREAFKYAQSINQFLAGPTTLTQVAYVKQNTLKKYLPYVDDESMLTQENLEKFYDFINSVGGNILTKMGMDSHQLFQGFFDAIKKGYTTKEVKQMFNDYMSTQVDLEWGDYVKKYKDASKGEKFDLFETISDVELEDISDFINSI